jgi:mannose-6-phosphate isomerase-like protein (cupin superfamily)
MIEAVSDPTSARTRAMLQKITVADEAAGLTEFWSQRVVAAANGNLFKVAKGTGSTTWHAHEDQDETFLLLSGELTVQLRAGDVHLRPGDLLVIPRGVEHCPTVVGEARFLLIGPEVTSTEAGGKPAWSRPKG